MANRLHNVFPGDSPAARDLAALVHPSTNLAAHEERGPLVLQRGAGVRVWDDAGREYIEGMAGLWCTVLGYGNEELIAAATEQMRTLSYGHMFGGKSHEPGIRLAEMLRDMVPIPSGRVFFGNSGSDANDTQVKLIRYYNNAIGRPRKKKIISRLKGYHGVTLASASLTGLPAFHRDFDLPIEGVLHVSCPHHRRYAEPGEGEEEFASRLAVELEALIEREGPDTIAAFIAEPIMGAGGVIVPPATYFAKIQEILQRHDILLIDDEVICGFGRTGKPFGADALDIRPDTMTLAKALSSAYLPISAVIVPEPIYDVLVEQSRKIGVFGHGFTYSGHPVCAAVAIRNLEILARDRIFARAAANGVPFQKRLRALAAHPLVFEARGMGMIGGLELARKDGTPFEPAAGIGAACADHCARRGLLVRNIGDTVAICPPLIISSEEIDVLFTRLEQGLDDTLRQSAGIPRSNSQGSADG